MEQGWTVLPHSRAVRAPDTPSQPAGETDGRLRILLVDDQPIVRFGLAALIEGASRYEVVAETGSAVEAVALTRQHQPDIAIMELRLPDSGGIDLCREIRAAHPGTRVIALSTFADESTVVEAIASGASGYLLKQSDRVQIMEAIAAVARGGTFLDPMVTRAVVAWLQRVGPAPASDPLATLSQQERRVLPLAAEGKTNREIGAALCLSEHTVKTYVSSILQKLHLTRRSEIAVYLARRGEVRGYLTGRRLGHGE